MSNILSYLNPVNWLTKIAGPKVLLGVILAASGVIIWLWLMYSWMQADVENMQSKLNGARQDLKQAINEKEIYMNQNRSLQNILQKKTEQLQQRNRKYSHLQNQLDEAIEDEEDEQLQQCYRKRLPDSVLDSLRIEQRSGNSDKNENSTPSKK